MIDVDKALCTKKEELLNYLRSRAAEILEEVRSTYGTLEFKEQATEVNQGVIETRSTLVKALTQKAIKEQWSSDEILTCTLMITYVSYVVMLESRNEVWPYDYMAFSRRVGELWEA